MSPEMRHQMLVGQYQALVSILNQKGANFTFNLTDEELKTLAESDLAGLVRMLRDVARTPLE